MRSSHVFLAALALIVGSAVANPRTDGEHTTFSPALEYWHVWLWTKTRMNRILNTSGSFQISSSGIPAAPYQNLILVVRGSYNLNHVEFERLVRRKLRAHEHDINFAIEKLWLYLDQALQGTLTCIIGVLFLHASWLSSDGWYEEDDSRGNMYQVK
jgi:hypothetical protein